MSAQPENAFGPAANDEDSQETREWLDSLEGVLQTEGTDRARYLLTQLKHKAVRSGVEIPFTANTPYVNSIPVDKQPAYPGDLAIERRVKSLIRWNAMAMVIRANKLEAGIGGHISIGDGARIAGQAGVFGDVPAGETWSGYPARPHRESLRATGALLKLPDILKKIEEVLDKKSSD